MRCEQSALTLPLSGNMRMWCGRRAAGSGRKRQTKTEAENTATETTAAATENKTQTDHKILPPHLHGKLIRSLSNSLTQFPLSVSLSLSLSREVIRVGEERYGVYADGRPAKVFNIYHFTLVPPPPAAPHARPALRGLALGANIEIRLKR